jgi:hypothetical protein
MNRADAGIGARSLLPGDLLVGQVGPRLAVMEDQLGALGLVVNCVAPWNTVYLDRILATLRESGYPVLDEDVLRIHPYW